MLGYLLGTVPEAPPLLAPCLLAQAEAPSTIIASGLSSSDPG